MTEPPLMSFTEISLGTKFAEAKMYEHEVHANLTYENTSFWSSGQGRLQDGYCRSGNSPPRKFIYTHAQNFKGKHRSLLQLKVTITRLVYQKDIFWRPGRPKITHPSCPYLSNWRTRRTRSQRRRRLRRARSFSLLRSQHGLICYTA